MSDELFEVAFSGQIKEGADLEQVKAKVGAMFKADATKLGHLFSGKRMVIKKNIDQATANKYKSALNNAGAVCEIKSLSESPVNTSVEPEPAQVSAAPASPDVKPASVATSGEIPAAPKTDPLGIGAGDISELTAAIAPVGSDMQDAINEVAEPSLDLTGLDLAPAGSDLGQKKKDDVPPPPDTNGLSLVD
ncbi:MAG: hypothetical protein OQK98_03140 [Gammaproteobacteria bacterium]|nr:hypothetical protein [Gammaproteobacteria bacterium]